MAAGKPTYTKHARKQMAIRRISESEVEQALVGHHISYTDRVGNPIYVGRVLGRRIKVVVRKDSDPPHVITTGD